MVDTLDITDEKISYNSIDDKDVIMIIKAVRTGIGYTMFYDLVKKTPFTLGEWSFFLNMSERTMQRHKKEKKAFAAIYSEKILQIALIYNLGIDVFGNKEKFNRWLEMPSLVLGNIKPK